MNFDQARLAIQTALISVKPDAVDKLKNALDDMTEKGPEKGAALALYAVLVDHSRISNQDFSAFKLNEKLELLRNTSIGKHFEAFKAWYLNDDRHLRSDATGTVLRAYLDKYSSSSVDEKAAPIISAATAPTGHGTKSSPLHQHGANADADAKKAAHHAKQTADAPASDKTATAAATTPTPKPSH